MRNITKLIGISTLTIALSMGSATAGIRSEEHTSELQSQR